MSGSRDLTRRTFCPSSLTANNGSLPSASIARLRASVTKSWPWGCNSLIRLNVEMVLMGTQPSLLQTVREKKNLSWGKLASEK